MRALRLARLFLSRLRRCGRARFLELIEREIANRKAGKPARIVAKMNQLEDPQTIQALCKASTTGALTGCLPHLVSSRLVGFPESGNDFLATLWARVIHS